MTLIAIVATFAATSIIASGFSWAAGATGEPSAVATSASAAATTSSAPVSLAPGSREWENILPPAKNLKLDGEAATAAGKPILIFFNLTGCHYCRGALREVIVPMFRNTDWRAALEFRQVTIDDGKTLIGFDGREVETFAFARAYKGTFTPTVIVVDGSGKPLGDAVVGIANFDFYGGYIDALAKKGIEQMRAAK